MIDIYSSSAVRYAEWCLEPGNRKVPKYVRKQAESWLSILRESDPEAYVDPASFRKICRLLGLPTVSGGIDLIANIVASTPIKLYRDSGGKATEVRDDYRIALLNDETGDTLNANEFWHAMIRDYYLGKGGYAYIRKERGKIRSLHYVDEREISVQTNNDPIFKDFDILRTATGTARSSQASRTAARSHSPDS